jgi:hypothetical protein
MNMKKKKKLCVAIALCGLLLFPAALIADECLDCHAGQQEWPLAPDVSLYWHGISPWQEGGHGDDDGLPALDCTGALGCHDLTTAESHLNGALEGLGSPSPNTFHLQKAFVTPDEGAPWSVAAAFNRACAETCHYTYGIFPCVGSGHADGSTIPYTPRFGYGSTPEDADGSCCERLVVLPVDSDMSTLAAREDPDYALCVSCHDPHGTGTIEPLRTRSNRMVRFQYLSRNELCRACHMDALSSGDSDGDGIPDCDDPFPYDPTGTAGFVAETLRMLSKSLSATNFYSSGSTGRRSTERMTFLERRLSKAAAAVDRGRYARATKDIDKVIALTEAEELQKELAHLARILGYLD